MDSFTETQREVWEAVRNMNDCWTKNKGMGLKEYFHRDMVAITPVDKLRRVGREACVDGWMGFVNSAEIHSWVEKEPLIRIYGNTAVITYYYELECSFSSGRTMLKGRDMFIMINEDGKWQAVADQFSPFPE